MTTIKKEGFEIELKPEKKFYFIGVTTKQSSINKIFPLWMKELGFQEIKLYPYDLKIHDDQKNYRKIVAQIKYDNNCYGALVTTHKMDLFVAAKGMFDYFDYYAKLLHEVSCISKKNNSLEGYAKDPISSGAAHDHFIKKGYYGKTGAQVLIFGAGGSSIATILYLINKKDKDDRPKKMIIVNRSQPRLDHLKKMIKKVKTDINIELICNNDPVKNDQILESLPSYSLIINATGMGKDISGSPITEKAKFPKKSWAWDFNYRGDLDFIHQAIKQQKSRKIKVEDGWIYFIHGWVQVISQALDIEINSMIFNKLKKIANSVK